MMMVQRVTTRAKQHVVEHKVLCAFLTVASRTLTGTTLLVGHCSFKEFKVLMNSMPVIVELLSVGYLNEKSFMHKALVYYSIIYYQMELAKFAKIANIAKYAKFAMGAKLRKARKTRKIEDLKHQFLR